MGDPALLMGGHQGVTIMGIKYCDTGLDGRCRDADGEIRRKRGDTLVGTLRQEYGEHFASGFRRDMKLENLLEREDASSLSELLRRRNR